MSQLQIDVLYTTEEKVCIYNNFQTFLDVRYVLECLEWAVWDNTTMYWPVPCQSNCTISALNTKNLPNLRGLLVYPSYYRAPWFFFRPSWIKMQSANTFYWSELCLDAISLFFTDRHEHFLSNIYEWGLQVIIWRVLEKK